MTDDLMRAALEPPPEAGTCSPSAAGRQAPRLPRPLRRPSGLVVVDVDTAKPGQAPPAHDPPVRNGADVFALLAAAHTDDCGPDAYAMFTARTGRGGTHLYYRHPNGPALRTRRTQCLPWGTRPPTTATVGLDWAETAQRL